MLHIASPDTPSPSTSLLGSPPLQKHRSAKTITTSNLTHPYTKAAAAASAAASASARLMRSSSSRISSSFSRMRQHHAPAEGTAASPSHGTAAVERDTNSPCRVGFGKLVEQEQQKSKESDNGWNSCVVLEEGGNSMLEVEVEISGVGISVVGEAQELAYLAVGELRGGVQIVQEKVRCPHRTGCISRCILIIHEQKLKPGLQKKISHPCCFIYCIATHSLHFTRLPYTSPWHPCAATTACPMLHTLWPLLHLSSVLGGVHPSSNLRPHLSPTPPT